MLKVKIIEEKLLEITNFAINTALNAKINQIKSEIPSISNLATATALNAKINQVKNILNVTNLVTIIAVTSAGN